jgi:hypothetical protein
VPANPAISATRKGGKILVKYRLRTGGADPWLLVTTVDNVTDDIAPISLRTRVKSKARGHVTQSIGLSRGKLVVYASVRARNGVRSDVVQVPVR